MPRRIGIVILVMSLSGLAVLGVRVGTASQASPEPEAGCVRDRCIPTLDELERKAPPEQGAKTRPEATRPEAIGTRSTSCAYRPPRGVP